MIKFLTAFFEFGKSIVDTIRYKRIREQRSKDALDAQRKADAKSGREAGERLAADMEAKLKKINERTTR